MAEFKLTDSEIGFISMMLQRIDPAKVINEAQNILGKINQYALEKQQEQATAAAEVTSGD